MLHRPILTGQEADRLGVMVPERYSQPMELTRNFTPPTNNMMNKAVVSCATEGQMNAYMHGTHMETRLNLSKLSGGDNLYGTVSD